MWGAVLHRSGDPALEVRQDIAFSGPPGPDQIRIRVESAGICRSDVTAMQGRFRISLPAILGHEVAGQVTEVGPSVAHISPGDRVIVATVPHCRRCTACLSGRPYLCVEQPKMWQPYSVHTLNAAKLYSFAGIGGFVEEMQLSADLAVPIPSDLPSHLACIIGCAVMTGAGAVLNEAKVEPGSTVVVFGCGGVGISMMQAARLSGASAIVAVGRGPARLQAALNNGATHAVTEQDLPQIRASLGGFDYAFEAVGTAATMRAAYDSVRQGGTAVITGMGERDDVVSFNAFEIAWRNKRFVGSTYGSGDAHRDFPKFVDLWRAGMLDLDALVTHRSSISEINSAIATFVNGEGVRHVVDF